MTHTETAARFPADYLAEFTDEALRTKIASTPSACRGAIRSARALLDVLDTPADRAEAAQRQIGLINRLRVRASEAMRLAALSVRDGQPRFTDEYHPNGPTA